ncbi:hypothetical protein PX701_09660 [Agromyces sp. H3Y2-19a]|uniref:hypothetical protein n=1 Tax=Agromyces TaxID=33877 RepID=UPI001E64CFD4|nr:MULTISPECIES: hypothetical protein [Agromyces]MCD5344936.1 hypothetical protein [Agromyces sp. S2-1-8]MDF0513886.1 hypothetical protein [Agromyces chromiiresistens]
MDEAFVPLHEMLPGLLPLAPPIDDREAGVRTTIVGCEVETPIELDLTVRGSSIEIGMVPPLYHVATADLPVFHAIRIVVEQEPDDG